MPYIKQEDRFKDVAGLFSAKEYNNDECIYYPELDEVIDCLISHIQEQEKRKGLCNYIISRIVAGGMKPEKWSYTSLSEARAVFTDAGEEFVRRMIVPYEDEARKKNGDVPEYEKGPNG